MQSELINDFTIRFANVNGTGSHSANLMLAKALFRSGNQVAVQNIFPSNIQGLPTWYEIRVGGTAMKGGKADIVVAANQKNIAVDLAETKAGGYFFYDSSKNLGDIRDDINYIPVPVSEVCTKEFNDENLFMLMKNVVFVGAVAAFIGADIDKLEALANEYKPEMIEHNRKALQIGYDYVCKTFASSPFKTLKCAGNADKIFVNGNRAMALGAIYGGATVAAWYPITPASSLIEIFTEHADEFRADKDGKKNYAVLQAEDELAAAGIVTGAGWAGARAFTATSGPGISLMGEFLGYAYFAEIPFVLIDVERGGPSTGMPTRSQQADILACAYAGHGDTKNILLFPSNPAEAFTMAADAFDIAEQMQTPVIVMSDMYLGINEHISAPFTWDDKRKYNRGKVLGAEELKNLQERFARYKDIDGDGIAYRTYPGVGEGKGAYFTRGTSHNAFAEYSEKSEDYLANIGRLKLKWQTAVKFVPAAVVEIDEGNKNAIICFGSTRDAVMEASLGNKVDVLRLTAFPFSNNAKEFIARHEKLFVVEQNSDAQMKSLLVNELQIDPKKLHAVLSLGGKAVTAIEIAKAIEGVK